MAHSFPRSEHEITLQQNDGLPKSSAEAVRRAPREKSGGTGDDQTRSPAAGHLDEDRDSTLAAVAPLHRPPHVSGAQHPPELETEQRDDGDEADNDQNPFQGHRASNSIGGWGRVLSH